MPIRPNLTPIGCQSDGNPVSIHANPMSIKRRSDVNQEPIQRQSLANPTSIQHQTDDNQVPICQSMTNPPNQHQYANPSPIRQSNVNPGPIHQSKCQSITQPCQSNVDLSPIRHSNANPIQICQFIIDPPIQRQSVTNAPIQCQSITNPCQSNVNPLHNPC